MVKNHASRNVLDYDRLTTHKSNAEVTTSNNDDKTDKVGK